MRLYNELLAAEVDIPETPQRIVSLAEDLTEILFMLGVGSRVAGVSLYCNRPPEASQKARVGSYLIVSYSKLEQLNPDLILTTSAAQRRVNVELHDKGYPVYPIPLPITVAGIIENVKRVGLLVGAVDVSSRVEKKLITNLTRIIHNSPRKRMRTYVEIDLGSPITVGAASYVDDALRLMGAENVFADRRESYFEPDMREVLTLQPEVIIFDPKPNDREAPVRFNRALAQRGWEKLPAVLKKRIIITQGDEVAHYGPSFITEIMPRLQERLQRMCEEND